MAETVKRLALKMKMYKVEGTPMHHTALCYLMLRRTIGDVKIVSGYAISGDKECCRHFWVEDSEGSRYDVAYELGCLYSPELKALPVEMTHQIPAEYQLMPGEENQNLFEMFQSNPKQFWQECPSSVKLFASNHLK